MKNRVWILMITPVIMLACIKEAADAGNNTSTVIPESIVPAAVISSFDNSFSDATETEWHRSGDHLFEAEFNFENARHEAWFDDDGHQSSHAVICVDGPVPGIVLDAFRNAFPTDDVYEWKLTNDDEWKAHFMRGNTKWEATYTRDGVQVKVEHD